MDQALILIYGLIAGSFLNVCAHRLPRGQSLARGRSRCPHCGQAVEARDNIPILSYLWLRGRCRGCGAAIGWRYPALELGCAAAFWWAWGRTGGGAEFVREAFFFACLLALAATDVECRQLPDEITLGGWVVGLGFAVWAPQAGGLMHPGWREALAASLGGAGFLALVALGYQRWRGQMGLGWGDVKMIGMLGAFLGFAGAYLALLAASVAAAAAGLGMALAVLAGRRRRGRTWRRAWEAATVYIARGPIPLGAFLAAAGAAALAWAPGIIGAWVH